MDVVHVVGRIDRTPLLILLVGLLRDGVPSPMRRPITRLRESRSCDHSHKRHSREQLHHRIISWLDLRHCRPQNELSLWNIFSMHEVLIRSSLVTCYLFYEIFISTQAIGMPCNPAYRRCVCCCFHMLLIRMCYALIADVMVAIVAEWPVDLESPTISPFWKVASHASVPGLMPGTSE